MNIGAEIPFRRRPGSRQATGSLIFDRRREEYLREHHGAEMRVWSNGRFCKS